MERYNSAVKVMLLYLEEWPAFAKREKSALDGGAKLTTLLVGILLTTECPVRVIPVDKGVVGGLALQRKPDALQMKCKTVFLYYCSTNRKS